MQQETALQESKTRGYPRKWLVVIIWILSSFAFLAELTFIFVSVWLRTSGRGGGNFGLQLQFDLIGLIFVAFWGGVIPATVLLFGLWASIKAPLRAKRSGTIAVALAWLGILIISNLKL